MRRSFYHFLMTHRNLKPQNDLQAFANAVYDDIAFPKHSSDYHEISTYLELNGSYVRSMSIFDDAWDLYEYDRT